MTDQLEQFFGRFGRSPFAQNALDPNMIAQELIEIGSGNVQPTGWYAGHSYSSSIGQANLLPDPEMASIAGWAYANPSTNITHGTNYTKLGLSTNATYGASFAANLGTVTANGFLNMPNWYSRSASGNPFNTEAGELKFYPGDVAGSADFYFETLATSLYASAPVPPYVVGSFRLANVYANWNWTKYTSATATVEIVQNPGTISETVLGTGQSWDLTQLFPTSGASAQFTNVQVWVPIAASLIASSPTNVGVRLHVQTVTSQASPSAMQLFIGEPMLHYNYTPDPLPYSPAIGSWAPAKLILRGDYGPNGDFIVCNSSGAYPGFKVLTNGSLYWGDTSTGQPDAQLSLGGFATSGNRGILVGNNGAGAWIIAQPSATQTLVAATAILSNANSVRVTAASPITLTAVPTVGGGLQTFDGQTIAITNVGSNTITFQDRGTLAGSTLALTATTVAVAARQTLNLMYNQGLSLWLQTSPVSAVL